MKPSGSSPALINYGNATAPFVGSPFAITNVVGRGGPTMSAPNLTGSAPRLAILEKITPPNVNATKGIQTAQARVRTRLTTVSRRTVKSLTGYARALAMRQKGGAIRFTQGIDTPLRSR